MVVPAYHEENKIVEALRRIEAYLSLGARPWEIVVCTDGSTDGTDAAVQAFAEALPEGRVRLLTTEVNRGKGAAVRRGVMASHGEIVLFTDADLSAPIKECEKLIAALSEGYDVAIGSRGVRSPGADVRQSPRRRLSGRVFNGLVRSITGLKFSDTQCGFKAFKREAARELFGEQKIDGFAFDVEILCLARTKGLRVKEVPVMWSEGLDSKIRLGADSCAMARELFRIRRLHPEGAR